jgi:Flp pilus assembly protein TadG
MLIRFLKNSRGGIAPIMAVAAIPLMGTVGMAIDYTRASATRTAFQAALDATALTLSKTAASQSASELQVSAEKYFQAHFTRGDAENVAITSGYSENGGSKVVLNGTASVKTNFLGILGINQINISAVSNAVWGDTRLRVALVLDNTGSMAQDDKMTALKVAAKNLLTQLQDAAKKPEDVYVSIIPFNKDVNLDPANVNASWVRWDLWEPKNGTCSDGSNSPDQNTCQVNHCFDTQYGNQTRCQNHNQVWLPPGTWTPASHSTWNGCVTDRDQNFDTTNDAPLTGSTLYPAEQFPSCPVTVMGLSNNWANLADKIDAMQPTGNTNQAIGLQLGWQSLTASPFTVPSIDPGYKYQQVVILLTDGLNTENRWSTTALPIDAREQRTCDNLKSEGVTIYTVQVNTRNDPTSTLLQGCASDSSKFFLLTSSTELVTTFNQIGNALTKLRIAM